MRFFIILFFAGIPMLCKAQPIIPWATQQPAWVFPLYFEDAIGQRDTIYLGYDPDAHFTQWPFTIDSIFGEYIFLQDTSVFYATAKSFLPDSIFKVDITLLNPGTGNLHYNITFSNFHLPLKVKWNKEQFYGNSLPFISQSPLPTAQAIFWMGSLYSEDFSCGGTQPILITDTAYDDCTYSDSIILDWQFNWNPSSDGRGIIIEPWTGEAPVDVVEVEKNGIKIFPNPASEKIYVITENNQNYDYVICDLLGNIIKESKTNNLFIDLSEISNGVYFMSLSNSKKIFTKTIIINH